MVASTGRSMSFFAVVVLSTLAVASAGGGLVYKVGGDKGWTILGNVNYSAWVSSKAFKVGDIIVFEYDNKFHNVLQVSRQDFHSCNANSPIATYTSGNDTIQLKRKGHYFFICGVPGHCAGGQSVDIRIPKITSAALAPSTEQTETPPPTSSIAHAPSPDSSSAADSSKGLGLALALVAAAATAATAAAVQSFIWA